MKATQKLCTAALTSALPLLMESRLPLLLGNLKFDETPQQSSLLCYYASFGSPKLSHLPFGHAGGGTIGKDSSLQMKPGKAGTLMLPANYPFFLYFFAILRSVPSPHRLGWKLYSPKNHFNAMHTSHADSQGSAKVRFSVTLAG